MKVLQVITSLSTGGAEKLLVDSVPLYQQKGILVDILCLKDNRTIFWNKLKSLSSGSITGLTQGSVYNPLLVFKMISHIRRYDLIHVHLFPTLYWVVIAKWISFSKTKIIYTEHNTDNRRRGSKIFTFLDRLIYRSLDKIVTIADEVDVKLKNHLKLNDERFKLINNGINVSHFADAKPYKKDIFFSTDDFILIQVSSFRDQKDQPTLIRSLPLLPSSIKLILVGEGNLKDECIALVKGLNLEERVLFVGNRNDVPNLLKTSDIAVLSSHHEGLSLSSIEGMASKPFVASKVPGLTEVVEGYGLLFNEKDEKDLAAKILSLYNDKNKYDLVASKCLSRAKQFDINEMVAQYIQLYNQLLQIEEN